MQVFSKLKQAFKAKPLAKAVSKFRAVTSGSLFTEQAVSQYNQFFDNLLRVDTDEVLNKVGIERYQLETLLFDDEIDEKVDRRIENLTQAKYTLSPSEGEVAEFIYKQLDNFLEPLLLSAMNAKLYGYSVSEYMEWSSSEMDKVILTKIGEDEYGKDEFSYRYNGRLISKDSYEKLFNIGLRYPKTFTEKPLEWFEPKNDGRLLWYPDNSMQPVEVDTKFKYLLMQHRPTYKNPKGKALLSRVYWLWYFKTNGWRFWSKFLERFGAPLLVGTTGGEPQALANALAMAHNQSIVGLPEGDTVNAISATGNGEAFKSYDDAINKRIAKYLLGQTLTTGVDKGGTYGQGKVHQEQQDIIFNSDKNFATKYVQQFINTICLLNGFEPPEFSFITEKGLQAERAERDSKLTAQGVEFTKDYYVDTYDIKENYIAKVRATADSLVVKELDSKAFNRLALNFAKEQGATKYSPEQQVLEDMADDVLNESVQPLDTKAILSAINDVKDETELAERLFAMVGQDLTDNEMRQLVNVVAMASDLHGVTDEYAEV